MFNEKQIRYVRRQITNSFYIMSKSKATCFPAKQFGTIQVDPISQSEVLEHGDGSSSFFCLLHCFTDKRTSIKQIKLLKAAHWTIISRQFSTVNVANINFKIKLLIGLLFLIFMFENKKNMSHKYYE